MIKLIFYFIIFEFLNFEFWFFFFLNAKWLFFSPNLTARIVIRTLFTKRRVRCKNVRNLMCLDKNRQAVTAFRPFSVSFSVVLEICPWNQSDKLPNSVKKESSLVYFPGANLYWELMRLLFCYLWEYSCVEIYRWTSKGRNYKDKNNKPDGER